MKMMRVSIALTSLFILFFAIANAQPPTGYYNAAAGKSCADLKTTLKTIISTGFNQQSYSDLWTQYPLTDVKAREVGTGSANVIWDVYSDNPTGADPYNYTPSSGQCGTYNSEGDCYNREHSIPQSWFGGTTSGPGADYLHIFPTDGYVNNRRDNHPYGEVGSATWTSLNGGKLGTSSIAGIAGVVFEPIDSFKGDLARAFFYFVTRYENNMSSYATNADAAPAFEPNTFPSVDIPYLEMMIRWHHLDPVSQKEQTRNNGAYSFQHNRNPYVDDPSYVDLVWNNTCPGLATLPVDVVYFGGKLIGENVKLEWTVANELSLNSYEVERSFNGTSFTNIGFVKAVKENKYTFTDNMAENLGRQVFYRLKKVDKDGKFSYTQVLRMHIPINNRFTIYPNPATSYIAIQMDNTKAGKATLQIADVTGKVIMQQAFENIESNTRLLTTALQNGTYFVKLICNGETFVQKLVVIK